MCTVYYVQILFFLYDRSNKWRKNLELPFFKLIRYTWPVWINSAMFFENPGNKLLSYLVLVSWGLTVVKWRFSQPSHDWASFSLSFLPRSLSVCLSSSNLLVSCLSWDVTTGYISFFSTIYTTDSSQFNYMEPKVNSSWTNKVLLFEKHRVKKYLYEFKALQIKKRECLIHNDTLKDFAWSRMKYILLWKFNGGFTTKVISEYLIPN